MSDEEYELYEKILEALQEKVNTMTSHLTPNSDGDHAIRQLLSENFRAWRD